MEEKDGKSNDKKGRHAKKHGGKRQRSVLNGFIISQVDPEHAKDPRRLRRTHRSFGRIFKRERS